MDEPANIQHLQIAFQTKKHTLIAVDDISFELRSGETLALLGESGCGKSITALGLMRLLPYSGVYGQQSKMMVDQDDLLNVPEFIMRGLRGKRLAMVFQEPMTALNPVLTIRDQLAEAIKDRQRLSKAELNQKLVDLLEKVEIPDPEIRLHQYPHQLSGGQKQRIVIAMAIANEPDILIADEPTTALDVTIQAQILTLLKKLQQEQQMSMLLITHDLGVVKAVADRVCVMYAGQLVEIAAASDFFLSVKHPYSQQLLSALPTFEKRGSPLQTIFGSVPSLEALPTGCRFHPRCAYVFEPCHSMMPQLQAVDTTSVRCHLYPQLTELPTLEAKKNTWMTKEEPHEAILQVEQLTVQFKTKPVFTAVDNLSFNLYPGKTLALVGESGCGKTTVSRAILGLLPIDSGDVIYRDSSLSTLHGKHLRNYRKRVQIIFQDPFSSMNPRMTIREILAEGMLAQRMNKSQIAKKQLQLLEQVNLPKTALNRYPHQFSGGQRQRICIARALATDPEILICDEPTSALDVSVQAQILNLLKELQINTGIAYLFITHNMAVVSYLADEVLVMRHGKIIEQGSCEQILTAPQQPYTQQLLACVLSVEQASNIIQ